MQKWSTGESSTYPIKSLLLWGSPGARCSIRHLQETATHFTINQHFTHTASHASAKRARVPEKKVAGPQAAYSELGSAGLLPVPQKWI